MLENHRKILIQQGASCVDNGFGKPEAFGQTVLPDKSPKWVENAQMRIFQHYVDME